MAKVKFESKSDYINFCNKSDVGNFPARYGSTYMYIDGGNKCEYIPLEKNRGYLDVEPKAYPCIMCYHEDVDGNFWGNFVYLEDFD